jgi:hypothetical protein
MAIHVTPIPQLIELAAPAFTLGLVNAAGAATTAVASDSTLLAFDNVVPASTSTANATGSAVTAPRRDHVHEGSQAATTAELVTATSTAVFVSPGRASYAPFALKVWGKFSQVGAQTILITDGLATITDTATGKTTLTFDDDFNGVNYAFAADTSSSSAVPGTFAAGSVVIDVYNASHANEDSSEVSIMLAGVWA